jgi:putative ATPase
VTVRAAAAGFPRLADIRQGSVGDVPDHLRDAHYAGAKELNRGIGYQYPHNFENGWVNQQ